MKLFVFSSDFLHLVSLFVVCFYPQFLFCKFVFKKVLKFCSAEFTLSMLFSEFLIIALFVIYSSHSMFVQSQLRTFSLVILSQYFHCLYSLEFFFSFGKKFVTCQGSLTFITESYLECISKFSLVPFH